MQFAAAASAFAATAGDSTGQDGRVLASSNMNLLHHENYKWDQAKTRDRQAPEPAGLPPATNVLKNKKARNRVASTIITKLQDLQNVVECDPRTEIVKDLRLKNHPDTASTGDRSSFAASAVDSAGDELGILSSACGVGRRCQDGFCVDVEDRFRHRILQTSTDPFQATDLSSYGGYETPTENPVTIVDSMRYACEYGSLIGYNCTCNFGTDTTNYYTGSATCITPTECTTEASVCGVEVTDCYQTTYTLSLKGTPGIWDATLCLRFLEPYEQEVCYETSTVDFANTVLPECKISLDGEQCTSCDVYAFLDGNCYNFDCGNTVLAGNGRGSMAGNTCSLPAHSVGLYLDTFGCPPCYLCGDDRVMMDPASTLEIFNITYQCAYVQDVALQGFFTVDSCNYFARIANEPCGCSEPVTPTDPVMPTEPVMPSETVMPTDMVMPSMAGNETDDVEMTLDMETDDFSGELPEEETDDFSGEIPEEGTECNICPGGVADPDGIIVMPGGEETSCSEADAAGLNGSIGGAESCEIFQEMAAGPCCGAPVDVVIDKQIVESEAPKDDFCSICGPNKTHTDDTNFVSVPTQGIYSCRELIAMSHNGTLDENGICVLVQLSAQTPCGCVADGPTEAPDDPTMPPSGMDPEEPQESGASRRFSLAAGLATIAAVAVASNLPW